MGREKNIDESGKTKQIRSEIADKVNSLIGDILRKVAEEICVDLGYMPASAYGFLINISKGRHFGSSTPGSGNFIIGNTELRKLGALFYLLGVKPDDPLVDRICSITPGFREYVHSSTCLYHSEDTRRKVGNYIGEERLRLAQARLKLEEKLERAKEEEDWRQLTQGFRRQCNRQIRNYLKGLNERYKGAPTEERQKLSKDLQAFLYYVEGEGLFRE